MFIAIIFLALRPPVEETISFLRSVLRTHGPDYLQIFLGPKAGNNLRQLGGVENLAIVLSGNDISSVGFHTINSFLTTI